MRSEPLAGVRRRSSGLILDAGRALADLDSRAVAMEVGTR